MNNKIELQIVGITRKKDNTNIFTIVLEGVKNLLRISILIGRSDAQAIIFILEKVNIYPPHAHQLLFNIIDKTKLSVKEVLIYDIKDETFYTKILLTDPSKQEIEFEAKLSVALAVAVYFFAPLFILEDVVKKGDLPYIQNTPTQNKKVEKPNAAILTSKIKEALEKEDYKLAAQLRDELKNIKTIKQ